MATPLENCFATKSLIITEAGIGQRIQHEFSLTPDKDIVNSGLLYEPAGRMALATIYRSYLQIAQEYQLPILLFTNTRRANKDRVLRSKFKDKNPMKDYSDFLRELASEYTCEAYIGGMMGSRGDAYTALEGMSTEEAIEYHTWQMNMFDVSSIDFLFAGIMPTLPEAIGMAKVMEKSNLPYILSLMINRNGTLLDGNTIHHTIDTIDSQTSRNPLCYMTNCVHPSILKEALLQKENQTQLVQARFCGIQANASCLSPQELDNSACLKTTTPTELAESFASLKSLFPLKIFGGCCGTNASHLIKIIEYVK